MANQANNRYHEASYKGVQFIITTISNTSGNRLAVHEFPQQNNPYIENLGVKAKRIQLEGYVIGEDWKDKRKKLEEALNGPKGTFIHPVTGPVVVECESFTVTEDVVNKQLTASFSIEFVEVGNQPSFKRVNTPFTLQKQTGINLAKLGDVFNSFYKLTRLPQQLIDELSDKVAELTGVSSPYQLLNVVETAKSLINGGFTIPWQVPVLMSTITSAYNLDYSDKGVKLFSNNTVNDITGSRYSIELSDRNIQTNKYTPKTAYIALLEYCNVEIKHRDSASTNSVTRLQQIEAGKRLELLFKSYALGEAMIAVSQNEFESLNEAQNAWSQTLYQFDVLVNLAVSINDDASYVILNDMKTLFIRDIQERAPYLNSLVYISVTTPTPSLVLAYNRYEDATRDVEIVARNKIRHPGFVLSNNLELLVE